MTTLSTGKPLQLRTIVNAVAWAAGLSPVDLTSSRRTPRLVDARSLAATLMREQNAYSLSIIGRAFGNRDHTTVLWSLRRYPLYCKNNPGLLTIEWRARERLKNGDTIAVEPAVDTSPHSAAVVTQPAPVLANLDPHIPWNARDWWAGNDRAFRSGMYAAGYRETTTPRLQGATS